jgi:hypothetical protein
VDKIREKKKRKKKVQISSEFSQKQHPSIVAVSGDCSISIRQDSYLLNYTEKNVNVPTSRS